MTWRSRESSQTYAVPAFVDQEGARFAAGRTSGIEKREERVEGLPRPCRDIPHHATGRAMLMSLRGESVGCRRASLHVDVLRAPDQSGPADADRETGPTGSTSPQDDRGIREGEASSALCTRDRTPRLDLSIRDPLFPYSALHSMCPPPHRDSDAPGVRRGHRVLVPRVGMARDAYSRIGGEHPLQALVRFPRPVGHDHHAGM